MSTQGPLPSETEPLETNVVWRDAFTQEELSQLLELHDWRSALSIAANWGLVAAAFALVAVWPNPLSVVAALLVIGGRQLGCAVIMHEAAHRTLFSNGALNDWAGNWLGAYPVWGDTAPYRRYHLLHHAHTGTEKDPDLSLVTPFPITRKSLWRKVWRDLSGQTGWKQAKLTLKNTLGLRQSQRTKGLRRGRRPEIGWRELVPVVVTNGVLLALCWLLAHPALYLLWVVAWLTTYRLSLRIRSIAEHALAGPAEDPLRNTRATEASWWERLLVAPNGVHYHLEHHLLMTVPHYSLPRFRRLLRERGVLDRALTANGYAEVLRQASARAA